MARVAATRPSNIEQPLTATFRGLFNKIWDKYDLRRDQGNPVPIGVCVSGGPDSMALAYLLKHVSEAAGKIKIKPMAFIVDHKARKDSGEEARFVRFQLGEAWYVSNNPSQGHAAYDSKGIESSILEMQWPPASDPTSLPDFELQARRARYRLIAHEAIRKRIHHLFLGHHQDDQVETILMRLVRNSSDSFLGRQGIPEHSTIPCCEDIRGAQTVDKYERFGAWLRRADGVRASQEQVKPMDVNQGKTVTPSQAGGLQIHRPLLAFSKPEIIRFCISNNISYVQDKTNYDPTLTLRNAVRHLRNNYMLPRALQGASVLELHKWSQNWAKSLAVRAKSILRMITVLTFDLRSGRTTVRLSKSFKYSCEADPEAGAYALARLTSMVTPR